MIDPTKIDAQGKAYCLGVLVKFASDVANTLPESATKEAYLDILTVAVAAVGDLLRAAWHTDVTKIPKPPDILSWQGGLLNGPDGNRWRRLFDSAAGSAILTEFQAEIDAHAVAERRAVRADWKSAQQTAREFLADIAAGVRGVYAEQQETK